MWRRNLWQLDRRGITCFGFCPICPTTPTRGDTSRRRHHVIAPIGYDPEGNYSTFARWARPARLSSNTKGPAYAHGHGVLGLSLRRSSCAGLCHFPITLFQPPQNSGLIFSSHEVRRTPRCLGQPCQRGQRTRCCHRLCRRKLFTPAPPTPPDEGPGLVDACAWDVTHIQFYRMVYSILGTRATAQRAAPLRWSGNGLTTTPSWTARCRR